MSKQFKVGDKVRYVGGSGWEFLDGRKGDIFTVHAMVESRFVPGRMFVRIVEGLEAYPTHTQVIHSFELVEKSQAFQVGDSVVIGKVSSDWKHYVPALDAHVGETVAVVSIDEAGDYLLAVGGGRYTVMYYPAEALTLAPVKREVRLIEKGTLLTTEFADESEAAQWLKDNECVGSFEVVRVVPLSKLTVKTAIVVEAA